MKTNALFLAALIAIGVPICGVHAQAINPLALRARAAQVEKQNSMNSPELRMRSMGGITNKDLADNSVDQRKNCTGGNCEGVEDIPVMPSGMAKKRSLTMAGPMRTHMEAVGSMAYVNQDFSYLSMPWIIKEITMAYLDMGVFGGQNSGYQKASGAVDIRGASEARLLQMAALNPEIRDVAVSSYTGCVAELQSAGSSYTSATDQCMEDSATGAASFANNGTGTASWLVNHPDQVSGSMGSAIKLVDLLTLGRGSPEVGPPTPEQSQVEAYKAAFRDIFGDMSIENASAVRGAPKGFTISVVPPNVPPAMHDKNLHQTVWVKVHELMRGYCEYWKSHMNVNPANHNPFALQFTGEWMWFYGFPLPVMGAAETSFWGNVNPNGSPKQYGTAYGPNATTFIDLSTRTFEFSPEVGDILFGMFMKTQDVKASSGRQGDLSCDVLKTGPNDNSNYAKLSNKADKHALEWRVLYDRVVNLIARGKRYEIYAAGRDWVDELTDGSLNSDTREKAYMLIRSVVSANPERMEQSLEEQSMALRQEFAKLQQAQVGVLGHSLAGVYADGPSKNLSSGAASGS